MSSSSTDNPCMKGSLSLQYLRCHLCSRSVVSSFRTSEISCLIELRRSDSDLSLVGFTRSDFSRPTPSLGDLL